MFKEKGWFEHILFTPELIQEAFNIISRVYKYSGELIDLDKYIIDIYKDNPNFAGECYDKLNSSKEIMDIFNNDNIESILKEFFTFKEQDVYVEPNNFQFLIMLPSQDREHLGWHQDSHYFYRGLENIFPCVVWTPFNTENMGIAGMIELLEGSHLSGATNHEKNLSSIRKKVNVDKRGAYYIELDEHLKSFKRIKKETISGNSIIMDSDLIHKTGKPNKNIIRFTAIWRYNFSYKK